MNQSRAAILVAGIVAGWAIGHWGTGRGIEPAAPQAAANAAGDRFQVSSWAAGTNAGWNYGAYVVDGQTGEVFFIERNAAPKSLGRVGK